jgi:molybdate transport system substrate-binding protein
VRNASTRLTVGCKDSDQSWHSAVLAWPLRKAAPSRHLVKAQPPEGTLSPIQMGMTNVPSPSQWPHWMQLCTVMLVALAGAAKAAQVQVAVAANFAAPMTELAESFSQATGHRLRMSFGSTAKLYAQIKHGAPFDVFLSADAQTPQRLEAQGLVVPGTRYTYATGRLVLWSATPGLVDPMGKVLHSKQFHTLALASPKLSPYGAATLEVLSQLGLLEFWKARFVQGESIGQTLNFVASGNAPLGFVALSQVLAQGRIHRGSAWVVPSSLHARLRQDAALLTRGQGQEAAAQLLAYLRSDPARAVMRRYGYEHEP